MKLKNIKIHNFFTFAEADVELGPKTFFITGENLDESSSDSNGSGKSLFCQSIVWCLFGDLLRRGNKKDDVIGTNSHYTSVILELEKDNKTIIIERYRNHDTYANTSRISVEGQDLTMHKDNDKQIEKILEIDSKIIYHCAYSDKRKQSIVDLTPSKLKEAVSEILQSDRYDSYIKAVRSEIKGSEGILTQLESTIKLLTDSEIKHNELLSNIDEKIKNHEKEIDEKLKVLYKEKNLELSKIKSKVEEATVTLCEHNFIDQELVKETYKECTAVEARVEKGELLLTQVDRNLFNLTKEIDHLDSLLENKEQCVTCGSSISDPTVFDSHDRINTKKKLERIELEKKKEKYEEKLEALNLGLTQFDVKGMSKAIEDHERLKEKYSANLQVLEREQAALEKHYRDIEGATKSDVNSLGKTKEEVLIQLIEYRAKLKSEKEKYALELDRPENLKTLNLILNEIRVSMYNDFVYSFRDKINQNLQEMTDGDFKCTLEESSGELEFYFTSPSKDGKMMIFPSFSDGEQARIAKAVALALESLVNIGFVIDDENLSGVDDAGVKAILDFVLSKNENKTFFFVGHQRAFKDYFVGYDNIHIIKEKGTSRVERKIL